MKGRIPADLPVPDLSPVTDWQWRLTRDYCVDAPPAGIVFVRAGFLTDGASRPRLVWRVWGHPFLGRSLPGAVVHDFLYQSELVPQAIADEAYRRLLVRATVSPARARTEWLFLRAAGRLAYRAHTPETVAAARALGSLTPHPEGA